jgi:hypothetical protein
MMSPTAFATGWREAHLAAAPASAELHSPYGLTTFDAGGTLTLQSPIHPPALTAGGPMNGHRSGERERRESRHGERAGISLTWIGKAKMSAAATSIAPARAMATGWETRPAR